MIWYQRLSSWRQLQPSRTTRCPFLSISHGELNCEEDWKKDISSPRRHRGSAQQTREVPSTHQPSSSQDFGASAHSRLAGRDCYRSCWICEVRRWRHVNGPRWWARCKQSRLTDTLLGHVLSFDTLSRALSPRALLPADATLQAVHSATLHYITVINTTLWENIATWYFVPSQMKINTIRISYRLFYHSDTLERLRIR